MRIYRYFVLNTVASRSMFKADIEIHEVIDVYQTTRRDSMSESSFFLPSSVNYSS